MKLSATMITLGETTLEAAVASIRPHVDEVVIAYNGTNDADWARVQRVADKAAWVRTFNDPETGEIRRFDLLRNASLDLCEHEAVVWLDSDDTVDGAEHLRAIAAEYVGKSGGFDVLHAARILFPYWYDFDRDTGIPTLVQWRERLIIGRSFFEWRKPVHEGLVAKEGVEAANVQRNEMVWRHGRKDFGASDERNLRILLAYIREHGTDDPRILYDYGMALAQVGERQRAADALRRFVDISGRPSEQAQACMKLSVVTGELHDLVTPAEWAVRAAGYEPQAFAPYYQLARIALLRGKLTEGDVRGDAMGEAIVWCRRALATSGDSLMPHSPHDRAVGVYEVLSDACRALGREDEAEQAAREGAVVSRDPALLLRYHRPSYIGADIVIACGDSDEPWNPASIARTGIGGSETAVVAMAERLASRGHRVRVYNRCGRQGLYGAVEYHDFWRLPEMTDEVDLLIAWRSAALLEDPPARAKWLWVHDATIFRPSPYWISLADRVLALSAWHASHLVEVHGKAIDPARINITRNGIDPQLFAGLDGVPRDCAKAVWASSPDRGLERLLWFWPDIKARVPAASLHVFYGDAGLRAQDPDRADRIKAALRDLAGADVVDRGRVDQRTLAREFMTAGVLPYATAFEETSCCHGDTRVAMPGNHKGGPPHRRIADLVGQSGFPVYAYDREKNRFTLATCKRVWQTKVADELLAIRLDSGQVLRVTPEHLVMNFDREWVRADSLRTDDRLLSLHYRYNVAIQDGNGRWTPEHRLVGEWKEGRPLRSDEHVDHRDPTRLDNSVGAIDVLTASAHFRKTHLGRKHSKVHQAAHVAGFKAWCEANPEKLRARGQKANRAMWDRIHALPPDEQAAWHARRAATRMATIAKRKAEDPAFLARIREEASKNGKKGCDARWGKASSDNNRVLSVERIEGAPVFDMEVDGLHNFIADGVVIHNCQVAMLAQCAGVDIVSSYLAALVETAVCGRLIEGDPDSVAYRGEFIETVVARMKTNDAGRADMAERARNHFDWDGVADQWHEWIRDIGAYFEPIYDEATAMSRAGAP